ncbi:MAG: ABC transporter permease subunit [Tissierellia bacterium]|nr:ABC transporter permease subunit [Tissierellia bacterium]
MNRLKRAFKSFFLLIKDNFSFGVKADIEGGMDPKANPKSDIDNKIPNQESNENELLKEEAITSPAKTAVKNYFRNPLGVVGLVVFLILLSVIFIGSRLLNFNANYTQGAMKNIGPGAGYMDFNKNLEKEGVKEISTGITFSAAVSEEGKLYVWGKSISDKVREIPDEIKEKIKDKKVEHVAAGDRHIIISTEDGEFYGWGNSAFGQDKIDLKNKSLIEKEGIKKLGAGVQYSVVLTNENNLVIWGSTLNTRLNVIPEDIKGKVVDFDAKGTNVMAILKDGSIRLLGVAGAEIDRNMPKELKDGSVKVKKVAITQKSAAALTEDGKLYTWGPKRDKLSEEFLPEFKAPIKDVIAGETHMSALDENGNIYSWGVDNYGETKIPETDQKFEKIFGSYFNNYAVDKEGKITTWGLNGFRFGTDDQGRDLFTRLIYGGQMTMFISFVSVLIQVVIGIIIGMISGYAGGRVDNVLMRFTEIISSFPFYPLIITLSALLPVNISQNTRIMLIMVLLGILGWTSIARLVRGQILAEREKDYIMAARALGVTNSSILVKHILPNVLSLVIVQATLGFASNLLVEAGLSFLGFGVQEPQPSWGNMMTAAQSTDVIKEYWWRWIIPALAVFSSALSVNLIGDALRDAIDPRANER